MTQSTAISAQGTSFFIAGTGGAGKTITGVAVGNPTVITSAAHGFANGDSVTLTGLTGADAALLNSKTTNTFCVAEDTTGKVITAAGTATTLANIPIANVKSGTGMDGTANEIDTTHLLSTAKEFLLGLMDSGSFSLDIDLDNGDPGHLALRAAQQSGQKKTFKITLPTGPTSNASFQGLVKKMSLITGVDQTVKSAIEVRVTGPVTWA